jgi:hypothetical protein
VRWNQVQVLLPCKFPNAKGQKQDWVSNITQDSFKFPTGGPCIRQRIYLVFVQELAFPNSTVLSQTKGREALTGITVGPSPVTGCVIVASLIMAEDLGAD